MTEMRETPLSTPPEWWMLEQADCFEEWAKRPDYDDAARALCLDQARQLREWAAKRYG